MAQSAWHWRTLSVKPWAETWLSENIKPLEADGLSVASVSVLEGDCELGHRKGKLLTIYDLRVETRWSATDRDGKKVRGTLVCPEMAHDMDEAAYEFEATVEEASPDADAFQRSARKALADAIRPIFAAFPKAMIETHGGSLRAAQQNGGSPATSGSATPVASAASAAAASAAAAAAGGSASAGGKDGDVLNTSTVRQTAEFRIQADELFDLLTNEAKVPMWSRNPAKIRPEKGAEVSLFNGNISGTVTEVEKPTRFVSTWRAPTWPAGHYGTLYTLLTQGSDATTLELRLTGVPRGEEEAVERNLDVFYIRSLKAIGLGTML